VVPKLKMAMRARAILAFVFMSLLPVLSGGSPVHAGTVQSVDVSIAGQNATVRVTIPQGFDAASSFALASPDRIVIDLEGAASAPRTFNGADGVMKVRLAQFSRDTARMVIDLSRPMAIGSVVASPERDSLVVSLNDASAATFAKMVRTGREQHVRPPKGDEAASSPASTNDTASPKKGAPAKAEPRRPPPLVVIDAGHGGHDTGAISVWGGRREKDVTLAIALAIRKAIEASGKVRVALTRSDDRFLALGERVEVARRLGADLFISIHADSAPGTDATGATVYTLSEVSSDREAARLAAKENKSDIINGVDLGKESADVSSILIDLSRRSTMNVSSSFAALLQRELGGRMKFKSQFHRFAGFRVLKAPDTPSVLLETGYLSNMDDARFLYSDAGQKAIAQGIKDAVEAHFARRLRGR